MKPLSILPYTELDGIRTFTDSQIMDLYDQMERDGTTRMVYFEERYSREEFLAEMKSGASRLYVVMEEEVPVAIAYLNRFERTSARLHFCVFSRAWGHTDEVARFVMKSMCGMKDNDGKPLFHVFLGMLPSCNKGAVDFILRNGGKLVGTVPNLFWDKANGKAVEGTIVYYENLHDV
jgi:hypothetical protein